MRPHASACPAARPSSRSSPRQRPAGPAATVAHGLVGLVLANQTSAATAATLDQHLRATGFPTSPTTARYSQKPARRDRFSVEIWDSSTRDCKWSDLSTACRRRAEGTVIAKPRCDSRPSSTVRIESSASQLSQRASRPAQQFEPASNPAGWTFNHPTYPWGDAPPMK